MVAKSSASISCCILFGACPLRFGKGLDVVVVVVVIEDEDSLSIGADGAREVKLNRDGGDEVVLGESENGE